MGAGRILQRVFIEAPEHENALRLRAFHLNEAAAKTATAIGDRRALSYALGYQGALYEFEKKLDEAATLTPARLRTRASRRRRPTASTAGSGKNARLLAKQGQRDAAIEATGGRENPREHPQRRRHPLAATGTRAPPSAKPAARFTRNSPTSSSNARIR